MQALAHLRQLQLLAFAAQLQLRQLLGQLGQFVVEAADAQTRSLVLKPLNALAQTLDRLLHMTDARLLHLGLLAWLSGALVKLIPGALPVLHGIFSALQRHAGVFFGGARHFQFGLDTVEFGLQIGQQRLVLGQMALRLLPG